MIRFLMFILFPVCVFGQSKPNVVFIWADDLGYGEISYHETTYSTPNIDSLFHNGMEFTNFHVSPICSASRYGFMTGKYPFRGNMDYNFVYQWDSIGLRKTEYSVSEAMKDEGYQTGMFGKWNIGGARPEHMPNSQGFDHFFGPAVGWTSLKSWHNIGDTYDVQVNGQDFRDTTYFATDWMTDKAIDWITLQADDTSTPFFLYMSYINPHDHATAWGGSDTIPYNTQADFDAAPGGYTTAKKRKWANIKNLDDNIGELMAALVSLAIDSNTIIIFTSDNGADPTNDPDNSPWTGDKRTTYEGGVRVPFVWYHPGSVDSSVTTQLAGIQDILPTLFNGVCGNSRTLNNIDGVNLYPVIQGGSISTRYWLGPLLKDRCWSVYRDNWKLVNNNGSSIIDNSSLLDNIELFDLDADPTESTDVSGSNGSIVTELQAIIDAETAPEYRTVESTEPSGWMNPNYWWNPAFYYHSNYYYQISEE